MIKGYTEKVDMFSRKGWEKAPRSRSLGRYERGTITLVKARENDVATIDVQGGETYVPVMKQLQEYISPAVFSS